MQKCFHGFYPDNCITCLSKRPAEGDWNQDQKRFEIPPFPIPKWPDFNEKEVVVKAQKSKKEKSGLSRDEKIRIAAMSLATQWIPSKNWYDFTDKKKLVECALWFNTYIRTGGAE